MTWSITLSIGIFMYLVLISKWSGHLLSVRPLWIGARVISAHNAPKRLWVSNMIQKIVPDSLVAAAYILIISRELERCRGSGGLRQHEHYQSPAFQWHGDAGEFRGHIWHNGISPTLPVTFSYPNSAKGTLCPVWFTSHARFCLFLILLNSDFLQQFVSLIQTLSLTFIWKLMLSWPEKFHIQHLKQERHHCVCASLNRWYWSGRLFCSST